MPVASRAEAADAPAAGRGVGKGSAMKATMAEQPPTAHALIAGLSFEYIVEDAKPLLEEMAREGNARQSIVHMTYLLDLLLIHKVIGGVRDRAVAQAQPCPFPPLPDPKTGC